MRKESTFVDSFFFLRNGFLGVRMTIWVRKLFLAVVTSVLSVKREPSSVLAATLPVKTLRLQVETSTLAVNV